MFLNLYFSINALFFTVNLAVPSIILERSTSDLTSEEPLRVARRDSFICLFNEPLDQIQMPFPGVSVNPIGKGPESTTFPFLKREGHVAGHHENEGPLSLRP